MRRVILAALLLAGAAGSCGGDDEVRVDAAATDASATDATSTDGPITCHGRDDCAGQLCCSSGASTTCVAGPEDCLGLILCETDDDCGPVDSHCCPQGFCGGCD